MGTYSVFLALPDYVEGWGSWVMTVVEAESIALAVEMAKITMAVKMAKEGLAKDPIDDPDDLRLMLVLEGRVKVLADDLSGY